MICTIRDTKTDEVIRTEDLTPVCGEDFCEHCGDCLACYGDLYCIVEDGHYFVRYETRGGGGQLRG